MNVGEIFFNSRHYCDAVTGEFRGKYFLILALSKGGDLVARVLTSRVHGRPESPPCSHSDPYPSFYLGQLGGRLSEKTWLDLRHHPDLDSRTIERKITNSIIEPVMALKGTLLIKAMECMAAAPDTTVIQEQCVRDALPSVR